jgi:hypothetical protein
MAAFRKAFVNLSDLLARPRTAAARFVFAIPVKPRRPTTQWDVVSRNLTRTIRSVQGATNGNFEIFLCGHEHPCPDIADIRITFVRAGFTYGPESEQGSQDTARKLTLIGSTLRRKGYDNVYVMFLDADDLVHKDLVEHVLATDNRRSYVIERGYGYDELTGRLLQRDKRFDGACGSSFIGWFENRDLPRHDSDRKSYYARFAPHTARRETATERNREPDVVPFPAAVYCVNHAESLERSQTGGAPRSFARRRLLDTATTREILVRDFSQPAD